MAIFFIILFYYIIPLFSRAIVNFNVKNVYYHKKTLKIVLSHRTLFFTSEVFYDKEDNWRYNCSFAYS